MTFPLAFDPINISHGGLTVELCPTLRAGLLIAQRYKGPDLLDRLNQIDVEAYRYLIGLGCNDQRRADAFLDMVSRSGLRHYQDFAFELYRFVIVSCGLDGEPSGMKQASTDEAPTGNPPTIAESLTQLFRYATGWLHWSPTDAWSATPAEIRIALDGHSELLHLIHGSSEAQDKAPTAYTADDLKRVDELGHDPAFERDKLRALNLKAGA